MSDKRKWYEHSSITELIRSLPSTAILVTVWLIFVQPLTVDIRSIQVDLVKLRTEVNELRQLVYNRLPITKGKQQ